METTGNTVRFVRGDKYPYFFIHGMSAIPERMHKAIVATIVQDLSYEVENAQRTDKYKRGEWDGRIILARKTKNGTIFFPVGLLENVMEIFDAFGIEYEVEKPWPDEYPYDLFGWKTRFELYDYQEEAVQTAMDHVENVDGCALVCLPTGSGKSLILMRLIYLLNRPTLILVHSKELLHQWDRNIRDTLGVVPSIIGDTRRDAFTPVTVAMVQTAYNMAIKENVDFGLFQVAICDESHRAPSDTIYSLFSKITAPIRLGATATPTRNDGAQLKIFASVGNITCNLTPVDLIKRGYLAKPIFWFRTPPSPRITKYKWAEIRTQGIVANAARNYEILKSVQELLQLGHKIYVHVDIIDHGDILVQLFRRYNVDVEFIRGRDTTKVRQITINRFQTGELSVLVSTLLKEGVDIPEISAYVNAAGGKSEIAQIQRVGRALRRKSGVNEAVVVDFVDYGNKILARHWEERYRTYKEYYGEYCTFSRGS